MIKGSLIIRSSEMILRDGFFGGGQGRLEMVIRNEEDIEEDICSTSDPRV